MDPWNYVTTQRFMTEDLPMFSALWWPRAELSELYILTCVVGWLFLWHDTVSEPQGARAYDSLAQPKNNRRHTGNSRSSAKVSRYEITDIRDYAKYGRDTKDFLRHCLQVISYEKAPKSSSVKEGIKVLWSNIATGRGLNNHYAVPKNLNSIIHRFESIGNQIRAVYTIGKYLLLNPWDGSLFHVHHLRLLTIPPQNNVSRSLMRLANTSTPPLRCRCTKLPVLS